MRQKQFIIWLSGIILVVVLTHVIEASASGNPVLEGVADAGVIRFNGDYYIMGVGTDGCFWKSPDLLQWDGPFHAFSMDNAWATGAANRDSEIHACDIVLHNGIFHLYWSVNYRLLRAIGCAQAQNILGPYQELNRDVPFDGRIDPQLFVDDDGACYFYTVKFTDGNVIYGQPMDGPTRLAGEAVKLLSALSETWEYMDHKVNEAPFVVRYRDHYYMLYNGNHTGLEYGNYAIGCAVAKAPLGFSNERKYPFPVLRDNWERIHKNARILSPLSLTEGVLWNYTESEPPENWARELPQSDTGSNGQGAFGNKQIFMLGGTLRSSWSSNAIWMHRQFTLDALPLNGDLRLFINHDADAEVFINGVSACRVSGFSGGYRLEEVSVAARETLKVGENVLAVHCIHDGVGAQYIDAGLYLFEDGTAEPAILNCGQPNLVRGPNGFEWWLVYFAVQNGNPQRYQAIERTHFFDRELFIEGPTTALTPGRRQAPALPTFKDSVDSEEPGHLWRFGSGLWRRESGALVQSDPIGLHRAHIQVPEYTHYLFETGIRPGDGEGGQSGIIAWERAPEQALYIGLDRSANTWFWVHRNEFVIRTEVYNLPADFNWDGWHTIRLEKNASRFTCFIDNIPAPGEYTIVVPEASGPGRPGLVTRDSAAIYDGVVLTAGWDECDMHIQGWGAASDGTPEKGSWHVGDGGLSVSAEGQEARCFKGDLLQNYEWSVQVKPDAPAEDAEFGAYVWFKDDRHHVRVALDANLTHLIITERWAGIPFPDRVIPLRLRARRLHSLEEVGINLRFVCEGDVLTVYADGFEVITLTSAWTPGRVGLFARNTGCSFNGITLFDRGTSYDN